MRTAVLGEGSCLSWIRGSLIPASREVPKRLRDQVLRTSGDHRLVVTAALHVGGSPCRNAGVEPIGDSLFACVVCSILRRDLPTNARLMNRKQLIAVLLMALAPIWAWLAYGSMQRGKSFIALLQCAAGLAFLVRGIAEYRKAGTD